MNHAEKEAYLREYSGFKNQGKPFFPYAVTKDAVMACIVLTVIIFLALLFGAELGPKADPTTTTYLPRDEERAEVHADGHDRGAHHLHDPVVPAAVL